MRIDRHSIVYLDPAGWPDILAAYPALQGMAVVSDWVGAGRPLVAKRRSCGDAAGSVALGLPLPPSHSKQRLAFAVPPALVLSICKPPLLAAAGSGAPAAWQPAIAALVALDPETRCFGSLAWSHLTGMAYLSATSDLDLLWQARCLDDIARLLPALAAVAAGAPMRIDGEVVTPQGLAIHWGEWASDAAELLAKTSNGSRLVRRAMLFA